MIADYLRDILDAVEKAERFTEGVNLEVVWQTIREDLPGFKAAIVKVLADVSNEKVGG